MTNSHSAQRSGASSTRIIRSRHDSSMIRTNRSAYALEFADRSRIRVTAAAVADERT
jgi:hypothetical protein